MTREGIFHKSCSVLCAAESLIIGAGFLIKIRAFNRSTGFINGRPTTKQQDCLYIKAMQNFDARSMPTSNLRIWVSKLSLGPPFMSKTSFLTKCFSGLVPHKHLISRNFTKQTNQQQNLISQNSRNPRISQIKHQSLYGNYSPFPGFS